MTDREAVLLKVRSAMRFRADRARHGLGRATAEEGRLEQQAFSRCVDKKLLDVLELEGLLEWQRPGIFTLTPAGLEAAARVR